MSAALQPDRLQLAAAVQTNCHIADAAHAQDMTLCIYLLQMREFYRWEQGIAPMASIARQALASWLSEREALWQSLEGQAYRPISLKGRLFDAFDLEGINDELAPHALVYGAGYTAPGRASFFLAELDAVQQRDAIRVYRIGREHARSLASPPATISQRGIELRSESLQRWLWEKFEQWSLRRPAGAFARALACYGGAQQAEAALVRMAQAQAETLILHELAEARVSQRLGETWQAMRMALAERQFDVRLRAARDLLADCLLTLPALLQRRDEASLHFWFSNFDGWRKQLFPALGSAYEAWCAGAGQARLHAEIGHGRQHWEEVCSQVLALYREQGQAAHARIRAALEPIGAH